MTDAEIRYALVTAGAVVIPGFELPESRLLAMRHVRWFERRTGGRPVRQYYDVLARQLLIYMLRWEGGEEMAKKKVVKKVAKKPVKVKKAARSATAAVGAGVTPPTE